MLPVARAERFALASHSLVPLVALVKQLQWTPLALWPAGERQLPARWCSCSLLQAGQRWGPAWPESWAELLRPTADDR